MLATLEALIEETTMPAGRCGRAALAVAHGDLDTALQLAERLEASMKDSVLQIRPYLNVEELYAFALLRADRPEESLTHVAAALDRSRETKMVQLEWRLLALKAAAESALGRADEAAQNRAEAKLIQQRVANSIGNADHRQSYLSGPVARSLEVEGGR